jgi:FAD:protein FMN transferase
MLIDGIEGIGTHWWFRIYDGIESSQYYRSVIIQEIEKFENAYSRFLPSSQISRLNRDRELINPSFELSELLAIGKNFYTITSGLFNPAIGHILENRGYDSEYTFQNKGQDRQATSFCDLVNISKGKIVLTGKGNIDLGGYGKGYLIDKLVKIFRDQLGLQHFLINGGGDIFASGIEPHEVILEHPFALGYELGRINLQNQALGCSSNRKRTWKDQKTGEEFGHIIDPYNLGSKLDFGSFVIASDTLTADVVATVICFLGDDEEKIRELKRSINFEFILVKPDLTMVTSFGDLLRTGN